MGTEGGKFGNVSRCALFCQKARIAWSLSLTKILFWLNFQILTMFYPGGTYLVNILPSRMLISNKYLHMARLNRH